MIPLLVAFLGVLSAWVGGFTVGRSETKRQRQQEARLAIAELVRGANVAAHTITWFTWKARHRPALVSAKDAEEYDEMMKEIYRGLTGSLAVAAAHSRASYQILEALVDEIYDLDDLVARAATGLLSGAGGASSAVATFHERAKPLAKKVSKCGVDLMDKVR